MKTNKFIAVAFATLFIAAFNACTKEEAPAAPEVPGVEGNLVEMTLMAAHPTPTPPANSSQVAAKSTFNGTRVGWEIDDQVAIYDGTAKRQFSVVSIEDGVATLKGKVSPDADATKFYAVFPYSAAGDSLPAEDGQLSLNLPAVQTLAEGKNFDEDAFVTVGKVEDGYVLLRNAVSVIKFNISDDNVTSVKLQGYAYENIAGAVSSAPNATVGEGESSSITLKPSGASFVPGVHYIAFLPTTFKDGFKLIYGKDGKMAVYKNTTDKTFERNQCVDFSNKIEQLTWLANPIMTEDELRTYFANQDDYAGETVKLGQNITLQQAWTPVTLTSTFDGQNYTISGVNVSAKGNIGFFANVKTGAVVKNLTIEGTIKAVKPSAAAKSCVGFAGLVSGTVWNCVNKANITLDADIAWQSLVGGIAGNVISGGTLHGCTNKGSITTTGTAGTEVWYIGGVAGYIGDPAGAGWSNNNAGGTLTSCVNEGALNIEGELVESIGGVVGMFRGGSITGCENKGTFTIGKTKANSSLGGVVGYIQNRSGKKLTITECTNNATIDLTGAATALSSVGGIVGMAHHQDYAAEVSGCYNKGAIRVSSTGALNIGGIVATYGGSNTLEFIFDDCHNQAPVSCVNLESTTAFLDVNTDVGGVAGAVGVKTKLESCSNSGAVSSNRLSKNYVGGIAGYTNGTATVLYSTNSGAVTANPFKGASTMNYVGGVVAYTTGTTTVSSSTNSGAVTVNVSKDVETAGYVGGIVGYTTGTVTMTDNVNAKTGNVSLVAKSTDSYRSTAGGVVGFTDAQEHVLTSNVNRASVLSDCPNIYTSAGGIVGVVRGNLTSSLNINFGDVTAASTSTSDTIMAGGIIGLFDMKGALGAADNKVATITGDKTFGHIKSQHSVGMLFAIYAWDCYGKADIKDCIIGGKISGKRPSTDAVTLTSTNFASYLWSWFRKQNTTDTALKVTLFQSNTKFGLASDYDK